MGSDQSSQHSRSRIKNPKRSQSNDARIGDRKGLTSSPRPSICSDSDIPYTSYVRTPSFSDETSSSDRKLRWNDFKPKSREKQINREKRDNKSKSVGSLVVVKAAAEIPTFEKDSLFQRLTEIPPFVPIIRGSIKIPWTRDPDITEKIDSIPLIRICLFYEERLTRHAQLIEKEQVKLTSQIGRLNTNLRSTLKSYGERQRKFCKFNERLSRVPELWNGLTKCHQHLNSALESIEILNNLLPTEDRLEPFVWTTG